MDYLRGRPEKKVVEKKKSRVEVPTNSLFETFAQTAFDMFTPDQRAWLYTEFLNENIISVLKDDDLYSCIDAFFKNNLNVAETSRNAFLHRNTLLYRIDKIHKLTGLNIRNFEDAITFKLLSKIYNRMNYR